MIVRDAIIIIGDTPVQMSADELQGFTGNQVFTKDDQFSKAVMAMLSDPYPSAPDHNGNMGDKPALPAVGCDSSICAV